MPFLMTLQQQTSLLYIVSYCLPPLTAIKVSMYCNCGWIDCTNISGSVKINQCYCTKLSVENLKISRMRVAMWSRRHFSVCICAGHDFAKV